MFKKSGIEISVRKVRKETNQVLFIYFWIILPFTSSQAWWTWIQALLAATNRSSSLFLSSRDFICSRISTRTMSDNDEKEKKPCQLSLWLWLFGGEKKDEKRLQTFFFQLIFHLVHLTLFSLSESSGTLILKEEVREREKEREGKEKKGKKKSATNLKKMTARENSLLLLIACLFCFLVIAFSKAFSLGNFLSLALTYLCKSPAWSSAKPELEAAEPVAEKDAPEDFLRLLVEVWCGGGVLLGRNSSSSSSSSSGSTS